MLIFENRGWQTSSDYPDTNYLEGTEEIQPRWVVHDNSEVAAKIMSTLCWEPVEDENGRLIDVVPVEPPESDEEKITALKNRLEELDRLAIRPLRAIAAGNESEEDRERLIELEEQVEGLREQISQLENAV